MHWVFAEQQSDEGFAELDIEHGVDQGVDGGAGVAQPQRHLQDHWGRRARAPSSSAQAQHLHWYFYNCYS